MSETTSKVVTFEALDQTGLSTAKLLAFAVVDPALAVAKLVSFAVLDPALVVSKLVAYAALDPAAPPATGAAAGMLFG